MGVFQNNIVHIAYISTDDDLILAACLHHLDNTLGRIQLFGICLALILQFEAQTGNAMCQRDDILFTADQFDDGFGKRIVIFCHSSPPVDFHVSGNLPLARIHLP